MRLKSQGEIPVEAAHSAPCPLRTSRLHQEKILDFGMIYKEQSLCNQPFEVQTELGAPQHTCTSIGLERNGNCFKLVYFGGSLFYC